VTENQLGIKGRSSKATTGTSGDMTKISTRWLFCRSVVEAFETAGAGEKAGILSEFPGILNSKKPGTQAGCLRYMPSSEIAS
jgi:hypothetical protein